jgi:hypothetical protein
MAPADEILSRKTEIALALKAIAEGYPTKGADDRYILVENPTYQPDDGSEPFLMIDIVPILNLLRCMGVSI